MLPKNVDMVEELFTLSKMKKVAGFQSKKFHKIT